MKHAIYGLMLATALAVPVAVHAEVSSDTLVQACKAKDASCLGYTLGGADRYWLVTNKQEACNVEADKKNVEDLKKAVQEKTSFYSGKKQPAAELLLKHLSAGKTSCALTMNFADLTNVCTAKEEAAQTTCHTYIAGVMDMAVLMDKQLRQKSGKPAKTPFCEGGKPKNQMSDPEIMQAIAEFGKTTTDANIGKVPASAVVMKAVMQKYSCAKQAAAAPTKTTATPDKK